MIECSAAWWSSTPALEAFRRHSEMTALPPGVVFGAAAGPVGLSATVGACLTAGLTLATARRSLRDADAELRRWYDRNAGAKVIR